MSVASWLSIDVPHPQKLQTYGITQNTKPIAVSYTTNKVKQEIASFTYKVRSHPLWDDVVNDPLYNRIVKVDIHNTLVTAGVLIVS